MCLQHGWAELQTRVAFVHTAFARTFIRGACHHIALPPDTAVAYRVENVTRVQLLHVYAQPFRSWLVCGSERDTQCPPFLHETVS